jgi:hypothetical protein
VLEINCYLFSRGDQDAALSVEGKPFTFSVISHLFGGVFKA